MEVRWLSRGKLLLCVWDAGGTRSGFDWLEVRLRTAARQLMNEVPIHGRNISTSEWTGRVNSRPKWEPALSYIQTWQRAETTFHTLPQHIDASWAFQAWLLAMKTKNKELCACLSSIPARIWALCSSKHAQVTHEVNIPPFMLQYKQICCSLISLKDRSFSLTWFAPVV